MQSVHSFFPVEANGINLQLLLALLLYCLRKILNAWMFHQVNDNTAIAYFVIHITQVGSMPLQTAKNAERVDI